MTSRAPKGALLYYQEYLFGRAELLKIYSSQPNHKHLKKLKARKISSNLIREAIFLTIWPLSFLQLLMSV